ncbi:hypothetical protein [Neolewinella sp.]|uniref:hypothetical protein n=1 Tax=Neolewinella sp. TaxID=2993543 RepID=UPI003B52E967
MLTPESIVGALIEIVLPDCFNPYRDLDSLHDRLDAPALRRRNLLTYLQVMAQLGPSELWVAESGSHTGTRRSGLPLVPTTELTGLNERFATTGFAVPTRTSDRAGMTAAFVWQAALERPNLPLFWNAVMAHPHRAGQPYHNRSVRRTELTAYQPVLQNLLKLFSFTTVIAIGRVAERTLVDVGISCRYVRHPAQGGARAFREGVE